MYFLKSGVTFLRFFVFFAIGVLLYYFFRVEFWLYGLGLSSILYLFTTLFIRFLNEEYQLIFFNSICSYAMLLFMGMGTVFFAFEDTSTKHFTNTRCSSAKAYIGKVIEAPVRKFNTFKTVLRVSGYLNEKNEWIVVHGNISCFIKEGGQVLAFGDELVVLGAPKSLKESDNPFGFDYKSYAITQGIYATHKLSASSYLVLSHNQREGVDAFANHLRSYCEKILQDNILGKKEKGLSIALILGTKNELDKELYEAFSATGVVHALAVSGLHVSLIYSIITFGFGFLKQIPFGKSIFALLAMVLLWIYALITGLCPSVLRAVTMFSLFLIAGLMKRNTTIFSILSFSAFLLVALNPFILLNVGFQFSFLAVIGIAFIHPVLLTFYKPERTYAVKLWTLASVSISAQLAVSPISIYYFHSFPLLFLPYNLVIIPLATIALYAGVLGLILSFWPIVSWLPFTLSDYTLRAMNALVLQSSSIGYGKLNYISISSLEVIICYLGIFSFFFAAKKKLFFGILFSMVLFGCIGLGRVFILYSSDRLNSFVVYKAGFKTVVGFLEKNTAILVSDSSLLLSDRAIKNATYNHFSNRNSDRIFIEQFGKENKLTNAIVLDRYTWGVVWKGKKIIRAQRLCSKEVYEWADFIILSSFAKLEKNFTHKTPKLILDPTFKGKVDESLLIKDLRSETAFVFEHQE